MAKANINAAVAASVSSITQRADKAAKTDATVLDIPDTTEGKKAKAIAHKAIDAVYNGYMEKGGIADLQAQIAKKTEGLSATVYGIALEAVKLGGNNLSLAKSYFLLLCKDAETYLRGKHMDKEGKSPTVEALCPPWQALKSQVKSGIDAGLNPSDFATQGAFRAAAKAKKDASRETGGAVSGNGAPAAGGLIPEAKIALDAMRSTVLKLTDEGQAEAAKLIRDCTMKVAALLRTNEGDAASDDEGEEAVG